MQLKNSLLSNPNFANALRVLAKKEIQIKHVIRLHEIIEAVPKQTKLVEGIRTEILKKHCKLNEKNELVVDENNNVTFLDDKNRTEAFEKLEELSNETFEVVLNERIPISGEDVMSYNDYRAIMDIVEVKA